MSLLIVNPIEFPHWNESLRSLPGHSFFHTSSWAETLRKSYGYQPFYFTLWQGGRLSAILPCMGIRSALTGRRGVCLPFTDYCEPAVSDAAQFQEMFAAAVDLGKKQRWQYLEIQGRGGLFPERGAVRMALRPYPRPDGRVPEVFSGLRDSTRRNIRKAEKEGIDVTVSASPDAVKAFCRLNAITRRDHGLPPQPRRFFQNVYDHILSKNMGFIVLASFRGAAIAANVYFHFGDQLIYKYGASDRAFQHLRANNLVMWEAIKWGCDHGYRTLCFGRTEPETRDSGNSRQAGALGNT